MPEVSLNYSAIIVAALVSMAVGALWYGAFSVAWMRAVGKTKNDLSSPKLGYALSALGALITALVLAHFVAYVNVFYPGLSDLKLGLATGFWVWLGFGMPTLTMKQLWEGQPWSLWLIDNGNQLLTYLVMGMILAVWR